MTPRPPTAREPVRWTIAALRAGQLIAGALFVVAIVLHLVARDELALGAATAAVIAVILTPATALMATALEARAGDRATVVAAGLVLLVLCAATGVALLIGR